MRCRSIRFYAALASLALGLTALAATAAPPAAPPIYRIALTGDIINPASAEYLLRSIERAQADNAACLILELDTPGGLLASTREIVKSIMASRVPIVTFVAPRGARAGSAGVFITLASHVAAMAPSTNIGAAHPVDLSGERKPSQDSLEELLGRMLQQKKDEGVDQEKGPKASKAEPGAPKPEPMEEKIVNDTRAWAEAIAAERGRNAAWARDAVTESASATDGQALELGIIDFIADDTADLLRKLDGRTVQLAGGPAVIRTAGAVVTDLPKDLRLRLLIALAHPNVAYILLMLGFYGLLFEITHPGAIFPGVAGAIALVLAFFGLQVLPTNYAGIALIVLAIALFVAEIKVVSYGLLTLGGLAALVAGSLMLFTSPHDFLRVSLPLIAAFSLSTLAVALFLAFVVGRAQRRRASTGIEGMAGSTGTVISWEGSRGKVFVHGEVWDATGPEGLSRGSSVEIAKVEGMMLIVRTSKEGL